MEPIPIHPTYGNPPRSHWRPRKPRKRPDAVPEKQFPGNAYRLTDGVDPAQSDQNGGDSDSSSYSSPSPYWKPGERRPVRRRKKKKPEPTQGFQPFSGKGYRIDGTPVGNPSPEISAAPPDAAPQAPTATRERWTPPTTTPSLKPPKRVFPSLGLGSRIKKLFPGRRNRNEGPNTAGPSQPLDPQAVEGGRRPARENTLFPGTVRKLDEGSPPASPRLSFDPAASHHSASESGDVPSLRGRSEAPRQDVKKFPGGPRLIQEPESESKEPRLAAVDPPRSDSGSSLRPSLDDPHYGDWVRWKRMQNEKAEKKALKMKWPGKAYQNKPPPRGPPAAGWRQPGLGLFGNRLKNGLNDAPRPRPEAPSSDSEGENSDASQRSGKKFPGTGYRLKDAAGDAME